MTSNFVKKLRQQSDYLELRGFISVISIISYILIALLAVIGLITAIVFHSVEEHGIVFVFFPIIGSFAATAVVRALKDFSLMLVDIANATLHIASTK